MNTRLSLGQTDSRKKSCLASLVKFQYCRTWRRISCGQRRGHYTRLEIWGKNRSAFRSDPLIPFPPARPPCERVPKRPPSSFSGAAALDDRAMIAVRAKKGDKAEASLTTLHFSRLRTCMAFLTHIHLTNPACFALASTYLSPISPTLSIHNRSTTFCSKQRLIEYPLCTALI